MPGGPLRMLPRNPAVLLSSCSSLPAPAVSCASWHPHLARTYAQHASHDDVDASWPEPSHPHRTPTPYQILSVQRGEAYSKHRFYALVKLYHPDRCHLSSPISHLPQPVRLERYRLLIAAHTILSDDAKRRAYDLWGQGWAGHQSTSALHSHPHGWTSESRRGHSGRDIMSNATWEDWEKWYEQQYGRPGKSDGADDGNAVYPTNFGFLSIILALVTIGGVMQGTRTNMLSSSAMQQRDKVNRETSRDLMRAKRASLSGGGRDERIKTFLEHREATIAGDEAYQRLLPPSANCMSDTARRQ